MILSIFLFNQIVYAVVNITLFLVHSLFTLGKLAKKPLTFVDFHGEEEKEEELLAT